MDIGIQHDVVDEFWYSTALNGMVQYSSVQYRLGHLKNISHPSLFPEEGPSCKCFKC